MPDYKHADRLIEVAGDLLKSDVVKSMKQYNHHGVIDTHYHSVHVAYYMCMACDKLKFSEEKIREIVRAALLHDLYLYNWYTDKHDELHAFYHPKASVENIKKYNLLDLTDMQRDMILRHMFPLGFFPNSQGGWMLTFYDKYCANREIMKMTKEYSEIYSYINQRTDNND